MDYLFIRGMKFSVSSLHVSKYLSVNSQLPNFLCRRLNSNLFCKVQNFEGANLRNLHQSTEKLNINKNVHLHKFHNNSKSILVRYSSSKPDPSEKPDNLNKNCENEEITSKKLSIFQRMKQMTKDYWHILIPVHIVTSIGWLSIFYACSKNGVDIIGILESMNLRESYLELIRGSNAGHWAITYALYKIFTPLRYTVTVGGTTMSIRYLNKWGYLKFKKNKKVNGCGSSVT